MPAERRDNSPGLFGPFRIGPLVGVGLPNLLSFGGTLKLTRFFGAGLNFGLIPTLKISYYGDATLAYKEVDIYGRIYPFGGAFFLGAGVGYETVRGTLADHVDTSAYAQQFPGANIPSAVDYDGRASVRTLVLTPQIGFLSMIGSFFCIGLDIGAQIPLAPSEVEFERNISNLPSAIRDEVERQYLTPNDQKVKDTLDRIGRTPLPTVNLRVGFLL